MNSSTIPFRAEHIRPRRTELNLHIATLAREAELCYPTVSKIESGDQRGWPSTLRKIEAALDRLEENPPGQMLRRARRARGLTVRQLAHQAGVHESTITSFERGERDVSEKILNKLSAALEIAAEIPAGEKLRARRTSLGLSVEELAKKAKLNPKTVSALERSDPQSRRVGRGRPARKLIKALDQLEGKGIVQFSFSSGAELKAARRALKIRQIDFAKSAGVTPDSLWMYETGRTARPHPRALHAYQRVLDQAAANQLRQGKTLYPRRKPGASKQGPTAVPVMGPRVIVGSFKEPVTIDGRQYHWRSFGEWQVADALARARPTGLTKDGIEKVNSDARAVIRRMLSRAEWSSVLFMAGAKGGRYRLL